MNKCESLEDLTELFVKRMKEKGIFQKLKSQLRAEIYHTVDASNDTNELSECESAPIPIRENLLINELIREYLEFSGYEHTSSVFCSEAEFGSKGPIMFYRDGIINEFGFHGVITDNGSRKHELPLIYELIEAAKAK